MSDDNLVNGCLVAFTADATNTGAVQIKLNSGWAKNFYRDTAAELAAGPDGWPGFDLVLLGIGSDGHLLSCFPESAAFDAPTWAVGVPAPTHIAPRVPRVTLNPAIVPAARAIRATVTARSR
mgnify:CR=1 FL=1